MVKALENDNACMKFLEVQKEVLIQGELFGVKWRGMVDVLNLEKGLVSDLKTTQAIQKIWRINIHRAIRIYRVDGNI